MIYYKSFYSKELSYKNRWRNLIQYLHVISMHASGSFYSFFIFSYIFNSSKKTQVLKALQERSRSKCERGTQTEVSSNFLRRLIIMSGFYINQNWIYALFLEFKEQKQLGFDSIWNRRESKWKTRWRVISPKWNALREWRNVVGSRNYGQQRIWRLARFVYTDFTSFRNEILFL